MGKPKVTAQMYRKYNAKYDGTNVTNAITAVKDIMDMRYQSAISVTFDVVDRVKALLAEKGVPPTQYAVYLSFALALASKTYSHSGNSLAIMASALKAQWKEEHGADPAILDAIIQEVTGLVAPY